MDEKDKSHRVCLKHTEREWSIIEKRLKEIGRKKLAGYLMSEIKIMEKQYRAAPDKFIKSIPPKKQKPIFLNESYLLILGVISLKTNIPIATLIDRLFVEPLMLPLD